MEPLKFSQRPVLFFYGTNNIAGCLLALGGLVLYFGGVIEAYWWLIVAGLYGRGDARAAAERSGEYRGRHGTVDGNAGRASQHTRLSRRKGPSTRGVGTAAQHPVCPEGAAAPFAPVARSRGYFRKGLVHGS